MSQKTLLSVNDLTISFGKKNELAEVIHNISFDVLDNEVIGIVGESGSGKSVTSLAIMGLLPSKNSKVTGEIFEF